MMISRFVLLLFVFGLAACGGSGGGSDNPPSSSAASSAAVSSSVSSVADSSSSSSSEPSSSSGASSTPPTVMRPLNDTGIRGCVNFDAPDYVDCPVADFPGQDGDYGRDPSYPNLIKTGSGDAGFDFTKIDAAGEPLSADATEWSCVRDNHTELMWEVKTRDGGLRDVIHTYSWYNPDAATNGGAAGAQNGGQCAGSACDTYAYTQAVNAAGLCGAHNWRLPTVGELMSIVHNGRTMPAIDTNYFPIGEEPHVWTSTPALGGYVYWDSEKNSCAWDSDGLKSAYTVRFDRGRTGFLGRGDRGCSHEYYIGGSIFLVRDVSH